MMESDRSMRGKAVTIHRITLKIDNEQGDLTFSPSVCHASRGDRLIWACDDQFVLDFEKSPIGESCVRGEMDARRGDHFAIAQVSRDAAPGLYTYKVSIYRNEKVYRDAACPDIIIRPADP
jgi:hypothetical protein